MPTLTTRLGTYGKGSALSHAEMDANWKRPVTAVTSTPVTLTEAHNRNIIECGTGSGTLALTAAATLAAIDTEDWFVDIVNTTSSAITIDPNGSETIDGASSDFTLLPYGRVKIWMNSTFDGFWTDKRYINGSFTGTISTTYITSEANATCYYSISGNNATVYLPATLAGTSQAASTALVITGLPAVLTPARTQIVLCRVINAGSTAIATATISGTSITFSAGPDTTDAFTASGTKGVRTQTISWTLQ